MPGVPELLVILLIVMLIFGAGKLPTIGDALGRSIKNFKRAASGGDEIEVGDGPAIEGNERQELEEGAVDSAAGAQVTEVAAKAEVAAQKRE